MEATSVGIALDHDFDKGLVDHGHLVLAVFVFKRHFLAADNAVQFRHVIRNCPVQSDVGKRSLGSPTGGGVDAINKGLDGLFDLFIGEVVGFDEGGEIGVEGAKCLSAGPFVLHDAEEVDHLVA